MTGTLAVLAALLVCAALAEWLGQRRFGRALGGALLVIILAALLANLGVIPTASAPFPLYDALLSVGAPVSIFLMLLEVHLAALRRAGSMMLIAFALAAVGTMAGVAIGFWLTDAASWLGASAAPLGGMFAATYIGGSANFNALALHYGVVNQGALYAGANAVDNVVTALWLAALLLLPALIHRIARTRPQPVVDADVARADAPNHLTLGSLALLLALAFSAHAVSAWLATWSAALGYPLPSILILTTLALLLAQLPAVQRLGGASLLGTYGAYLFLAVIGAHCDLAALMQLGQLGAQLLGFVLLAVAVHGVVVFGAGAALRIPPEVMAVASSASVGGAATAMPVARSLGRMDLVLPGVLVGSLGTALGTYLGFFVVWMLTP